MKRVSIPLPDGEITYWVENAARHFNITEPQFLMMCLEGAWKHLYAKSFSWKDFTIVEKKYLEELESHRCSQSTSGGGIYTGRSTGHSAGRKRPTRD